MRYVTKEHLRTNLSLAWVAAQLGIPVEGDLALCPFHEDSRPSFRIWQTEDGVDRWHCYPCDRGGDVFDLIQGVEHLTFPDALERAEELLGDQPNDTSRPRVAQRALEYDVNQVVSDARARAASNANDGWLCVIAGVLPETAPALERRRWDGLLRDTLGWGADEKGNVLVPHWNLAGQLTGVKVRAWDGAKWALPGSSFMDLYGSWGAKRHDAVLLTEGESDMAWALLQGVDIDVRSLPAGAKGPTDAWLTDLSRWSWVYMALDADDAGRAATVDWLDHRNDIRVCRLPRDHDLRSAEPDLTALLRAAGSPAPPQPGLAVANDRYERTSTRGQVRPLTSWWAEPVAHLVPGSPEDHARPAVEVITHHGGRLERGVISADDLHSSSRLRTWAADRSLDLVASDQDVQTISSHLLAATTTLPLIFQSDRVGIRNAPKEFGGGGRTVVTPSGHVGRLPWRYVGNAVEPAHVHLDDDGVFDWNWLRALLAMNQPHITTPLVAWLAAATRRTEVRHFPLLMMSGSSGSGKTTLARLAARFFGSSMAGQLGETTPFALMMLLSASTTLPVFIDEWTRRSRDDAMRAFQGSIPVLYEGGVARRGRSDLSVAEYRLTAPTIVAGEDAFHLDREIERTIVLRTRRQGANPDALAAIAMVPVERFAHWFYRWLVEQDDLPPFQHVARDRHEYNRAILLTGWETLHAYLDDARRLDTDVPDLPELDLSALDVARDDHVNEYEEAIAEGAGMRDTSGKPLVWMDPNGRGTWVRFRLLVPALEQRTDVDLPGRSRAMRAYFEERYELEEGRPEVVISGIPTNERVRATLIQGCFLGDADETPMPNIVS